MMSSSSQPLPSETPENPSGESKTVVSPPPCVPTPAVAATPTPKHVMTPPPAPTPHQPMASPSYGYPQHPHSFPNYARGMPDSKPSNQPIIMGNLSLFVIVLSLFFLSAFTFFSGLLLGLWVAGPKQPIPQTASYGAPQMMAPMTVGPATPVPSPSASADLTQIAGEAAGDAVSGINIPYVPTSVASTVGDLQHLVADKAQHVAERTATNIEKHLFPSSSHHPAMYTVQLGVFATKENAEDLKHKLKEAHYRVYVKEERSIDHVAYHVYSGHYGTYSEASLAAKQFTTYPGAIVVKLPESEHKAHE